MDSLQLITIIVSQLIITLIFFMVNVFLHNETRKEVKALKERQDIQNEKQNIQMGRIIQLLTQFIDILEQEVK